MKTPHGAILVRLPLLLTLAIWLTGSGCDSVSLPGPSSSSAVSADPFKEAIADAEPGEKRFIEAVKPSLDAIARRDWTGFYNALSSHAKAKMNTFQFDQIPKPGATEPEQTVVTSPDEKAFAELVARTEAAYGRPTRIEHLYVDSTEPDVLSGKGDKLEALFAIGAMPEEIPSDIRKASIRAQFQREYKPDEVTAIAKELEISEEDVKAGKWPEDADVEERPYFNFKCVLVEENGELKIGYFEFMPPSMLD